MDVRNLSLESADENWNRDTAENDNRPVMSQTAGTNNSSVNRRKIAT